MVGFCDLLGTLYAPVSKTPSVKKENCLVSSVRYTIMYFPLDRNLGILNVVDVELLCLIDNSNYVKKSC